MVLPGGWRHTQVESGQLCFGCVCSLTRLRADVTGAPSKRQCWPELLATRRCAVGGV